MNLLVDIKILPYHISLGSCITKISSLSLTHTYTYTPPEKEGRWKQGFEKIPHGRILTIFNDLI